MRVLFVNRMASMVRGGGETFDLEISRHLELLGCETSFLSGIPVFGKAQSPLSRSRSFTIRTPYLGWFPWDQVKGGWRLRLADFWIFEHSAAAWAAAHRDLFDIIQVCELPTFVLDWKRRGMKQPVVMRLTAPDYVDNGGAMGKADAIIASGATMEKVRQVRPDCIDIPNAVDAEQFKPQPSSFRTDHGIGPDEFVVLFVARFQAVKNHKMLIEAFRLFRSSWPKARLVLVGSGPLESRIREQCRQAGIEQNVVFLGEVPHDRLPAVYAAADLKVIASYYESFCFAALEAMASGLPLVVTETDWVPRLIDRDRGGVVVASDDAAGFAGAMMRLAEDRTLRRNMGSFNRDKIEREFRWEVSAQKLASLYARLIPA